MNKFFLFVLFFIIFLAISAASFHVIYLPADILNLFPLFHTSDSSIPHNTLASDPVFQFEPWRYFVKEQLAHGQFPLWNSFNAGGVPLFANAQSAVLFPLNFIYYLLPISLSLNIMVLLKLFLLYFFSFIYLKTIGISRRSSIVGSFCITFSGFPMVWSLWPHTNVFLFLPLFLFLTERIKSGINNLHRWYVLLSLTYFLAILGGHYETLTHMMLLHGAYVFFRLYYSKKKLLFTILSVSVGFFLAALQLIPFLEYFSNSYAYAFRTHSPYLYLPYQSFILNFVPFISGAPHLKFYRPIVPITNFQESISGYTGVIVMIVSVVGASWLIKKDRLFKFWVASSVFFWLLAFKIWPVGLMLELPILSQAQNSRLSAIAAFSTVIVFSFTFEQISSVLREKLKMLNIAFGTFLIFVLSIIFFIEILFLFTNNQLFRHPYTPQLIYHLAFIFITTLLFWLSFKKAKRGKIFALLTMLLVGSQTIFLLSDYIPLINDKLYYPTPTIVKKLQSLTPGTILEVGNPSIPPDVNLTYSVSSAENYDGLEVKEYKMNFDKAFPVKNQWGKVDRVGLKSLHQFNIKYVLSDFDLNDLRQGVQTKQTEIIGPLTSDKIVSTTFVPLGEILRSIRILPANYNRKNFCTLTVEIISDSTKESLFRKSISCAELLDKMFYTISVPDINLPHNNRYLLKFKTIEVKENAIGLWGNDNTPFVELYYQSSIKPQYDYLGNYNSVQLFNVPDSQSITIDGEHHVLNETNTSTLIEYNARSNSNIEIKKINYPGWKAKIDGKEVDVFSIGPFIGLRGEKGRHILEIYYAPLSFQAGILISIFTFIILSIYFLRDEAKTIFWKRFFKKFANYQNSYIRKFNLKYFFLVYLFIFFCGTILFISFEALFSSLKPTQFTTVINWLTLHNHSLTKDYYTVGLLIVIIPVCVITGWLILIWKKDH